MNQKSFIKNLLRFIFRHQIRSKVKALTPHEAVVLQKEYVAQKCDIEAPYTEPYVVLAQQLFDSKAEVFRAAAYYLEQIALNKPDAATPILAVLQNYAANNPRSEEDKKLLNEAIEAIRTKYNL